MSRLLFLSRFVVYRFQKIGCLLLLLGMAGITLAAPPVLLVVGDSLSAGYGIAKPQSWPSLLQTRLAAEKRPETVINASISGETSAGGKSRLPALLKTHRPAILILALGANDGLRGLPLAALRDNLLQMVQMARQAGVAVLLVGMALPPNYGADYTRAFAATFAEVARTEKTAFLPFLLEPIAQDSSAFQADHLHPTAAAQTKILEPVWQALLPLLPLLKKPR